MNVKVIDLMSKDVITARADYTIENIKERMRSRGLKCIPIVRDNDEVLGIVSLSDILKVENPNASVTSVMTKKVFTIPEYEDVQIAARIMRNHKIHHIVVTKEKKAIGIVSSLDLLKLVEGKRFEMKNRSTERKHGTGRRNALEN
ncbi:MAG: CBS domain-containing protein [Halobacteriovoraceae bacterium]|nr:CBS domain-containing protein [Halobacteriovoraceae bacterium]